MSDFDKFAISRGVNSIGLSRYKKEINDRLINPYIVEERVGNPTQIDVFSKMFTNRILFLGTEIDADVSNIICSQLLYLQMDGANKAINIYINSPGGSVYDGLGIYDTMQYISCPVHTTCTGLAASMASVLLAAGEKGSRAALPHSRVLVHQPMTGAYGQASDIQIVNEEIQKLKKELFEILAKHSGQTYDKLVTLGDRDCWLTSNEALELGLIDKVL